MGLSKMITKNYLAGFVDGEGSISNARLKLLLEQTKLMR